MPLLKPEELRKLSDEQLEDRLGELRAELSKLRSAVARGVLRKESGKIRSLRRDIARVLTIIAERRVGG